jgi:hypothetical protein
MKREKTQTGKIRNKKGKIITNTTEVQGIIRDYFENLYSNKLENLEEMDKFLDAYDHSKLIQGDINQLNRSIACNKIKQQERVSQKRIAQDLADAQLNSTRPPKQN